MVIWAAGEYQYPSQGAFLGSDLCLHTSRINSYSNLDGEDYLIIGGYESGIDAAYHLSKHGKSVRVFDQNCPWGKKVLTLVWLSPHIHSNGFKV